MADNQVKIAILIEDSTAEKAVGRLQNAFGSLENAVNKSARSTRNAFSDIERDAPKINSAWQNAFGQIEQKGAGTAKTLTNAFSSFVGNIASDAVQRFIGLLEQGAQEVLRFSASIEQSKIAFNVLLGSSDAATAHLQELYAFARKTPFEVEGLIESSQKLQAMGFNAKEVIPTLHAIGNAVAAAGGGADRLDRVVLAISQIRAKGRVQGQELLQLAENGIPALQLLSEELGKSNREILDLVEKGQIGAAQFQEAFNKFSDARFGDLMQQQSYTFNGALSNIKDTLRLTAATAFEPMYREIGNIGVRTAEEIENSNFDEALSRVMFGAGEAAGAAFRDGLASTSINLVSALTGASTVAGFVSGVAGLNAYSDSIASTERELYKVIRAEKLKNQAMSEGAASARADENALQSLKNTTDLTTKQTDKLVDIYKDAADWLKVFKTNSQEVSTIQKLLSIDIGAVNTNLGQQAIEAARAADALQLVLDRQREDADIRANATSKLFSSFSGVSDSISRFSNELTNRVEGFSGELVQKQDLINRVSELKALADALIKDGTLSGDNAAKAERNIQVLEDNLKSLDETYTNFLQKTQQQKSDDFFKGLFETSAKTIGELKLAYDLLGEGEKLGKLNAGEVQALRNELEWANFVRENSSKLTKENLDLALIEIDRLGEQKVRYANLTAAKQKEIEATAFYNATLSRYDDALRGSIELTESEKLAKDLLSDTNRHLTDSERALLIEKAKQVDAYQAEQQAIKKTQEEMKKLFDEMKNFVKSSLSFVIKGDFKGLLNSIKETFQERFLDKASDFITEKLLGFNPKNENTVIGQIKQSNNYLKQIAANTGSIGVGAATRPRIVGQTAEINIPGLGKINLGGLNGLGILGGGSYGGTPPVVASSGNASGGILGSLINRLTGGNSYSNLGFTGSDGRLFLDPAKVGIGNGANRSFFSQLLGKGGIFGEKGFGNNVGTYAGIGMGASLLGGLIGGKVGGFISGAGAGLGMGAQIGSMIMPGIGTAVGAAIGAIGGGLLSLLGGDPKRKADARENLPALQKGFADALAALREMVAQARKYPYSFDVEGGLSRARELRDQVASGFGIKFESKKYSKVAAEQISQKTAEANQLYAELQRLADDAKDMQSARAARQSLVAEFATGVYMDKNFAAQFQNFKRRNGMLPGVFTGRDVVPAMLAPGEMVLNPTQISAVIAATGFDPFRYAKVPNYPGYADGNYFQPSAPAPQQIAARAGNEINYVTIPLTVDVPASSGANEAQLERQVERIVKSANGQTWVIEVIKQIRLDRR